MTIFFSETFPVDGAIVGQVPQVTISPGMAWASDGGGSYLVASSGYAVVSSPANSNTGATLIYGGSGVNYLKPAPIRVTFTIKTPPNLGNVDGVSHGGVVLTIKCGGLSTAVKVWGYLSGGVITWYANINTTTYVIITSELAGSTEYTGVLDISDGSQVFTFLGHALSNTNAFSNSLGFNGVDLVVWGYSSVGQIVVGSNVDGNGDYIAPIHGDVSLIAPSPLVRSTYEYCVAQLNAPAPTLSAFGGTNVAFTAPSPTLTATGHNSYGEQAAFLTAPSPLLSITTGANARPTAPSPMLSASGAVTGWAKSALTAPAVTLTASGKVAGMANAALTAPSPNISIYSGSVCSITLLGRVTIQSTGTTGGIGGAAMTCPLFELTSTGAAENHGSANLMAPSAQLGAQAQAWLTAPSARLTAIGTAVVTATYEAYAVNLKHNPRPGNDQPVDEATRYTNFPFTHVVRYQNSYYGANSTGLYLLEGSTDDGTPIPWAVQTAMTDFKTPNKKTLAAAYFSGRLGPASTISLIEGEHTPSVYSFTTPRGTLAQNHRQKFGKGTKGRYYALSASGTGTCELDGIEPEVHQLTRRI